MTNTVFRWVSGSVTNAAPSPMLSIGQYVMGSIYVEGVDLSIVTGTLVYNQGVGPIVVKDCKLNSGVTMGTGAIGQTTDIIRSDSTGNYRMERHSDWGDETTNTAVVRTGGASDGVTPVAHQIKTGSNLWWWEPFQAIPITIWNGVIATNRDVTIYGVVNAAAVPNNNDAWIDVEYLGASGSPLGSVATSATANVLTTGSALTADSTSAWDSAATARANSHAYVVGNVIKLASNPGRIFFCTTAGTSAGSEPGGYASAVDGGSVTDGGATFRAGCRFSISVTLSAPQPAQVGYLTVQPKFAKASTTYLIDPLHCAELSR